MLTSKTQRGATGIGVLIIFIALIIAMTIASSIVPQSAGLTGPPEHEGPATRDGDATSAGEPEQTTQIDVKISNQAVGLLGFLVVGIMAARSATIQTAGRTTVMRAKRGLTHCLDRVRQRNHDPVEEVRAKYVNGKISDAELERQVGRAVDQSDEYPDFETDER